MVGLLLVLPNVGRGVGGFTGDNLDLWSGDDLATVLSACTFLARTLLPPSHPALPMSSTPRKEATHLDPVPSILNCGFCTTNVQTSSHSLYVFKCPYIVS